MVHLEIHPLESRSGEDHTKLYQIMQFCLHFALAWKCEINLFAKQNY